MAYGESQSRFELVAAELRERGLIIRRWPGEYRVNFRNGGDRTARFAEDLDQALEIGREMAAKAAADRTAAKRAPRRRKRWRKRMTPKARRRRFIRAHNRRARARVLRKQRDER